MMEKNIKKMMMTSNDDYVLNGLFKKMKRLNFFSVRLASTILK